MFKNLQAGFPVYVLDKSGKLPAFYQGNVMNVSKPHYDQNTQFGQFPAMTPMVVDVTVEYGGKTDTFTVDENATYNTGTTLSLSCDHLLIANEVRAMKKRSDDVIDSVNYHKSVSVECENILKALNPQFAETEAQNARIKNLEEGMAGINNLLLEIRQSLQPSPSPKSKKE